MMVHFGGKPSRGCQTCRNRKIKCDLKVGGCSYCQKIGNVCPGFRAEVDIIFRDESQHVADKVRRKASEGSKTPKQPKKKRSTKSLEPCSTACGGRAISQKSIEYDLFSTDNSFEFVWDDAIFSSPLPSTESFEPSSTMLKQYNHVYASSSYSESSFDAPSPTPPLEVCLEDQALGFFFTYNVLRGHDIRSLNNDNCGVLSSCLAVGFAGLSCYKKTQHIQLESRRSYVKAIQEVNAALADPARVKEDGTLFAIILLGQAEQIGGTQKSFVGWDQHIRGAGAMLALRGTQSLKTAVQIRLFHQAIAALISSCLRMRIAFPAGIIELLELATRNSDKTDPSYRALILSVKLTTWLAKIRSGILTDFQLIVEGARALEMEAQEVFVATRKTSDWSYESVYQATSDDISMLNYYHVYKSWIAIQTWTGIRAGRMLIHEAMMTALLASAEQGLSSFSTEEINTQLYISNSVISQLRTDMLASVAQQLNNNLSFSMPSQTGSFSVHQAYPTPLFLWSNFAEPVPSYYRMVHSPKDLPFVRSSSGVLPWVLYLIGASPGVTSSQQKSILSALNYIGHNLCMKQAFSLASGLEERVSKPTLGLSLRGIRSTWSSTFVESGLRLDAGRA